MKNVILGTAGHIDHGKTSLIKALTGVDTDRLAEEKRRGISIDLGFTRLKLEGGATVGVVDVPGHEKFVKNMLAGATGIDILLLVIAADDGVMPQTKEHLAIAEILGIKRGMVALTKADLVEPAWLKMVASDIKTLLEGGNFKGSPIIPVSSITGQGLPELLREIESAAAQVKEKDSSGAARLPIDRVFTIKGAGTVVTGTLWSGRIRPEDQLMVEPAGSSVRVRGVSVHDEQVKEALAGQRVAVNLSGIDLDELKRGDVLASPGFLSETLIFDAKFRLLASEKKPLKTGGRVRVYHGTKEVLARVRLFSSGELGADENGYVRFELEESLSLRLGDRYIVRRYSPVMTIGGGTVLDVNPKYSKRSKESLLSRLKIIDSGDEKEILKLLMSEAKTTFSLSKLARGYDFSKGFLSGILSSSEKEKEVVRLQGDKEDRYMTAAVFSGAKERIKKALTHYHGQNPLSEGMKKDLLRAEALSGFDQKEADALLAKLKGEGMIEVKGDVVSDADFMGGSNETGLAGAEELFVLIESGGFSPPTLAEIEGRGEFSPSELKEYLRMLTSSGRVARIKHDLFYESGFLAKIEEGLLSYLREKGRINPADFRELFGLSRKYILPLLEYFDAKKLTKRVGNDRVLR